MFDGSHGTKSRKEGWPKGRELSLVHRSKPQLKGLRGGQVASHGSVGHVKSYDPCRHRESNSSCKLPGPLALANE